MNKTKILLGIYCLFLLAACRKDDGLSVFNAPVSPYEQAVVEHPVTAAVKTRVDQKYRTTDISLAELGVTPAEDAVFYAHHDAQNDWCGEDWYTAEHGFYIDADGYACGRSKDNARLFVEYHPSERKIAVGQIPDACKPGETYTFEVGFATMTSKLPVRMTVSILESLPWAKYIEHEDGLTYTVYENVNTDYTALEISINEDAVMTALGITSISPLLDAMQSDDAFDTTMRGLNADGAYDDYAKYTANVAGYWFDQNGNVCEWKGEKWGAFIEWDRTSPMIFRLGQAVENNVAGSRYDMKIALILDGKEAVLTFKLKIVDEVTDDLGTL